jgi:hypothetical protein
MNVCVKDQSPQTANWSEKDSPHQTTELEPPNRSLCLPLSLEQISLLLSFVPEFDSLGFDNIGQFLDGFDVCGFEDGERSELRLAKSQWIFAMSSPVGKGKKKKKNSMREIRIDKYNKIMIHMWTVQRLMWRCTVNRCKPNLF